MLFPEEEADLLKAWIVKRLEKNSNADADADVLADYVLALLRQKGSPDTIQGLFQEELHDFLREDTAAFTGDVFQAVQFRSYVPGAAPAPPAPPTARHPRVLPPATTAHVAPRSEILPSSTSLYHPSAPFSESLTPATFPQPGSRKRAYNDRDDGDVDIILNSQSQHDPPQKQPRRGGAFGQRGGRNDNSFLPNSLRGVPQFPEPPGSLPYGDSPLIDTNSILQNMQFLQSLLPPGADLPPLPTSGRRKKRCRDYEKKGYCSRGTHCNFNHNETEQPFMLPPMPMVVDEYDPNNAVLSLPPFGVQAPPAGQQLDPTSFSPFPPTNRREAKKPRRMKGRPPFAANGRNNDKSKTTIVVQNIPSENFSEDQIRGYFSQFGTIIEIQLQHQNCLAIIKFDSWEAANAAWSSPKVIFDNRFVKVFWHKDESSGKTTPNGNRANNAANGHVDGTTSADKPVLAEPGLDLEEFHRKQLEAQKIHDEKTRKRQEIERERQKLEERQKALSEQRAEATRLLQVKLKSNGLKDELSSPTTIIAESDGKRPNTQTEALRAQLAALEQEANQLGINPDENHDDVSSWTLRGRGRGRGFRGRGTFVPRAIRGGYGYRGRGGIVESRHAAYAAYSLDNRPKVVALSGVDFTIPENDEALRQYLFSVGEFKEVHGAPAVTHVTFKDRKTADKFMFGVSANNTIHGIDGKIEPTWAKTAPETTKTADSDMAIAGSLDDGQNNEKKPDTEMDDANEDLEDGEIESAVDHDRGDMDYDAGEW